ncbi:hypothetical protein AgCh_023134 [Apium graveolens]
MLTSVGGGVSACRGLHSSFHPTQGGLSLNLDVLTTVIVTAGPVIDFLRANQGIQDARRIDWIKVKKMLRNMRVKATHSNREFKIKGLSEKPCNELYFTLKEKPGDIGSRGEVNPKEITVYEYFRRHLNLEFRTSAYFSCLDVGKPSKRINLPLVSFFHDDSRMLTSVGGGVSACRGLHSSFHPTQGGLSLNLDVLTTVIVTAGPVIDFLRANQGIQDARRIDWIKVKKMLRNMRVKATHSNREFKIKGLSEKPCNELYFTLKEKPGDIGSRGEVNPKEITVYEYFRRHLNLEFRTSAYFSCLDVGKPSKRINLPLVVSKHDSDIFAYSSFFIF